MLTFVDKGEQGVNNCHESAYVILKWPLIVKLSILTIYCDAKLFFNLLSQLAPKKFEFLTIRKLFILITGFCKFYIVY